MISAGRSEVLDPYIEVKIVGNICPDSLGEGNKEFLAEVKTIGSIHQVNLVKLIGFCIEKTVQISSLQVKEQWIFR